MLQEQLVGPPSMLRLTGPPGSYGDAHSQQADVNRWLIAPPGGQPVGSKPDRRGRYPALGPPGSHAAQMARDTHYGPPGLNEDDIHPGPPSEMRLSQALRENSERERGDESQQGPPVLLMEHQHAAAPGLDGR